MSENSSATAVEQSNSQVKKPAETSPKVLDAKKAAQNSKTLKFLRALLMFGKTSASVAVGPVDEIASAVLTAIPSSGHVQEAALGTKPQATWRGKDIVATPVPTKPHVSGEGPPRPPNPTK